jgi:hypothetical protein
VVAFRFPQRAERYLAHRSQPIMSVAFRGVSLPMPASAELLTARRREDLKIERHSLHLKRVNNSVRERSSMLLCEFHTGTWVRIGFQPATSRAEQPPEPATYSAEFRVVGTLLEMFSMPASSPFG